MLFLFVKKFAKRMSENTLNQAIKKMGYNHRAHGWRASFSTLCYEHQKEHGFSSEVIETQLAHSVGNKVTRAYMRSDFLEERRELLQWWEKFLSI
jgi:integrase